MQMSLFTQPAAFYSKGLSVGEDFRDELRRGGYPEACEGTERPARRYTQPGG